MRGDIIHDSPHFLFGMKKIDTKITDFIQSHHLLTIATSKSNEPYCANAFYVYLEKENMLVFMSHEDTKHIRDAFLQKIVAGTIAAETNDINLIKGIQFQGILSKLEFGMLLSAKKHYLKKFPYSKMLTADFYGIEITFIKMTDNTLGFGKKLVWKKTKSTYCSYMRVLE